MKFRRRFATGGFLSRLVRSLGAARTTVPSSERAPLDRLVASWPYDRRHSITVVGVFLATLVLGYGLAATMLFPAPIITTSRSIPRVLGESEEQARETLRAAGFSLGAIERVPHPTVPAGAVVWQDPPPDVVAPEATEVALTLSAGPQRVPVPDVAGYDAAEARTLIEGAGLRVGSTESTQAPTPRNVAVNTRPTAGTMLAPGSSVILVVSVGAATIRVPTLTGLTLDEARLALETAGLALGTSFAQTTNAAAPGEVFYQEPTAGTLSAPGTVVNVRIARSP
jgi:serine/threonine-protein kinase